MCHMCENIPDVLLCMGVCVCMCERVSVHSHARLGGCALSGCVIKDGIMKIFGPSVGGGVSDALAKKSASILKHFVVCRCAALRTAANGQQIRSHVRPPTTLHLTPISPPPVV